MSLEHIRGALSNVNHRLAPVREHPALSEGGPTRRNLASLVIELRKHTRHMLHVRVILIFQRHLIPGSPACGAVVYSLAQEKWEKQVESVRKNMTPGTGGFGILQTVGYKNRSLGHER